MDPVRFKHVEQSNSKQLGEENSPKYIQLLLRPNCTKDGARI